MVLFLVFLILLLLIGAITMGSIILDKLSTQALAIADLQSRVANQSGITAAQAQQIADAIDANTATLNTILA